MSESQIVNDLISWGEKNGIKITKGLKFVNLPNKGISCIASEELGGQQPIIEVPSDIIFCSKQIQEFLPGIEIDSQDSNTCLKIILCKLKFDTKDSNSPHRFEPYINALPEIIDSPLNWNEDELKLLQNTNLGNCLKERFQNVYDEWFKFLEKYQNYQEFETQSETSWYNFSNFLWAHLIITSRSFPEYIINPNCPRDSVMLLPVLDLLNHSNYSKVEWDGNKGGNFIYKKLDLQEIEIGDEIYNNYGGKGNEELLNGYGFVIEDNLFDSVLLKIKIDNETITDMANRGIKIPQLEDYTWFAFDKPKEGEPVAPSLQGEVIFLINKHHDESIQDMINIFAFLNRKQIHEDFAQPINQLEGIQMLRNAIEYKLMKHQEPITNAKDDDDKEKQKINEYRKKCSEIYRNGQISIFKEVIGKLKKLEKTILKSGKKLLTMDKIIKNDQEFIERELQEFFRGKEIVFETHMEILVIWILVKIRNNSFPVKCGWVQKMYDSQEGLLFYSDNESDEFYQRLDLHEQITAEACNRGFHFIKSNVYTRISNDECIFIGEF
ncbi:hypothetical protein TBLA_0A06190 [Henningerozyma blattae CBS 6284]|uniref:SET domain-containing protein n=1 Tax=Henningerozyma blattae (strain ATCC 34711 / CBS 6284 / DSM 70876 / NBRC 10599 / NRRL Y-10934 / UCD 77-7) TaxID=1071380 RepID=I2GWA9_HENB6|nr:hypothetical protein TBLA_0A06190 [Tetrapisispora blattae CBS 6284]CCH58411.1 hypothetical protein TBLA_0A06190 [Tetrapisispora blattae CBS 6284]